MVLMIMRAPADAATLEELSRRNPNPFEQLRDKALELGGADFLVKGDPLEELVTALRPRQGE